MRIRRYTFKIEGDDGILYNQEKERIFILSDIGKETRERCKKCAHTFTLNDTDFWPDLVYMISYDLYKHEIPERKNVLCNAICKAVFNCAKTANIEYEY